MELKFISEKSSNDYDFDMLVQDYMKFAEVKNLSEKRTSKDINSIVESYLFEKNKFSKNVNIFMKKANIKIAQAKPSINPLATNPVPAGTAPPLLKNPTESVAEEKSTPKPAAAPAAPAAPGAKVTPMTQEEQRELDSINKMRVFNKQLPFKTLEEAKIGRQNETRNAADSKTTIIGYLANDDMDSILRTNIDERGIRNIVSGIVSNAPKNRGNSAEGHLKNILAYLSTRYGINGTNSARMRDVFIGLILDHQGEQGLLEQAGKDRYEQNQQDRDARSERSHNRSLTQEQRNSEMSEARNTTNNSLQNGRGRGSIQRQRQRF